MGVVFDAVVADVLSYDATSSPSITAVVAAAAKLSVCHSVSVVYTF